MLGRAQMGEGFHVHHILGDGVIARTADDIGACGQGGARNAFNPVGQIVGRMDKPRPARDVIFDMVSECIDATERMRRLMDATAEV